jgi:hypothetical protein
MSTFRVVSAVLVGAVVGGPAAFLFAVLCSALAWSPDVLSPTGGAGLAAAVAGAAYGAMMGYAYYRDGQQGRGRGRTAMTPEPGKLLGEVEEALKGRN